MSEISSKENTGKLTEFLRLSLSYTGLFIIPGLVGSVLVGDIVLTIYGSAFKTGYYILIMLTFARLVYGYKAQLGTVLAAMDRPELTFRIDIVFVTTNVILNLILTWWYGWYGAATATIISAIIGCGISYYYTKQHVDIIIPKEALIKQMFAAGVMAVIVYICRFLFGDSLMIIMIVVGGGATTYFVILFAIWQDFRSTVIQNLPTSVLPAFV